MAVILSPVTGITIVLSGQGEVITRNRLDKNDLAESVTAALHLSLSGYGGIPRNESGNLATLAAIRRA
jgi:hypothetical protein